MTILWLHSSNWPLSAVPEHCSTRSRRPQAGWFSRGYGPFPSMKPADLSKLRIPSDIRFSPQGRFAFVVTTPDVERDFNSKELWVGGEQPPSSFTSGFADSAPRWSPDGDKLAFLRTEEKSPKQVAVMSSAGGEAKTITGFAHGVEAVEWAPDGSRLLVVGVTPTEEWDALDPEERERKPRVITQVPYRYDNKGWTHDRRRHLWLVDPHRDSDPVCLTPGDFDEEHPAWSPDSKNVAFISTRQTNPGLIAGNQVWEVSLDSHEVSPASPLGYWSEVSYRPDGVLHMIGSQSNDYPVNWSLHRCEADGSLIDLTGGLDRSSYSFAVDRAPIRWRGEVAIVGHEDSGSFGLIAIAPDGTVTQLINEPAVVSSFDVSETKIAYTSSTTTSPGEVFVLEADEARQTTNLRDESLEVVEPEHFRVLSEGVEIDAWVYLPPGEDRVPLLLNIHGGPASQYGHGFFDEFQVYVSAGYGVVACNPRGSTGRGLAFNRAVIGDGWGKVDHADVVSAVQASLERFERLDPDRMGLMGGSYGGFLTAWIIGQEQRWKSAIVERALLSWTSFAGTSDIGGTFPHAYTRKDYPDAWEKWWELSPISLASGVQTPTLIVHAEDDFRCPIEQAEQYFMALLRNGTTTAFIRFPNEGHEMSRSGSPRHRKERFDAILDWHQRHLR